MGAQYITRERVEEVRGERGFAWAGAGLWWEGPLSILARPTVAIVGTRAASGYGRRLARRFAAELGAAGCCIASGLALGIDSAAHQGALDAAAPTVGVLGSGHLRFFPRTNQALAQRMLVSGGAIASPFEPECPALPHQFLERNGVVAGIADAVVVIEAPARSGALNTANWAAGRIPVLAVPGDVDRAHVAGCHALIRDGATLARNSADVLETLGLRANVIRQRPAPPADPLGASILAALADGESTLDALAAALALPTAELLAALAILELHGLAEARNGRFVAL